MAEQVTIEGQRYVRRDPWGVLALSIVTLGIYALYWYWAINDEARRFLKDESIRPWIALLAVSLGWVVLVPPFISIYHTGQRIERMQFQAGVTNTINVVINLVLFVFINIFGYWYAQGELNKVWDAAGGGSGRSALPPPPA